MTVASNKSSRGATITSGGESSPERSSNGQREKTPKVLDLPVGLDASGTRHETDSMGGIDVPADRYWGRRPSGRWFTSRSATTGCPTRSTTPTGT